MYFENLYFSIFSLNALNISIPRIVQCSNNTITNKSLF